MKKVFYTVLTVIFWMCLFSVCAFAAPSLDFEASTTDLSGEGYTWKQEQKLLYLKDADLVFEKGDGILLPAGSRIRFEGDCSISATDGSGIRASGLLTIIGNGTLKVSGSRYGISGEDTVLLADGITVTGRTAAAKGLIEADGGYEMRVSNGNDFLAEAYRDHKTVRTGMLYPVYVTVTQGGGASFYAGMYAPGQEVVITARAQYGYALTKWSSPYIKIEQPEAETIRFTMPKKSVRVYGTFEKVYSVTIPELEGGHVEMITEGNWYAPNKQVVLYAVPDTGYYFSHWTTDYGRFRDPLQAYAALTMPSVDVTVRPVFVKGESYYLKVETIGEGETNIVMGNFPQNKSVLLRAFPAEGYVFSGWMSEAGHFISSLSETTYFTMPGENVTITAVFSLAEEYKKELTVEPLVGGTVNVTGGLYAPGMPITLKAEAKTGYEFVGWSIEPEKYQSAFLDGNFAETDFLMPAEDVKISARFALLDAEAVTFYLSVGQSEGGTVTSEGSGEYLAGYEFDLSATADEGYYFAGWKSAVGGKFENAVDANTIFYMPANDTKVTAVFSKIIDPTVSKPSESEPPIDGAELDGFFPKEYVSFGASLLLCAGIAAGGTIYADVARKEAGLLPRRRRHRRTVKEPKAKRKL